MLRNFSLESLSSLVLSYCVRGIIFLGRKEEGDGAGKMCCTGNSLDGTDGTQEEEPR